VADTMLGAATDEGRPWQEASRLPGDRPRERKVVTAMFVDIVRSSAMVAGRDPEDADDLLLSILNRVTEAVPRFEGTVTQMLGDGFLATFGAPGAKEDHALRACLAAQDILSATRDEQGRPLFHIRIGISSGDVVAHVVTNGLWTDYRAVGECVHMAAKLQQRAASDTAQLSRDTLDLIPVGVAVRPMGSLRLSDEVEPMPAFLLDGARAVRRTATDLLSATDAPHVGREEEVATLFAIADSVEAGASAQLLLQGEAGIGKSRLVGEFLRDPRSRRWTLLQWPQMPIRRLADPDDLEAVALSLAEQVAGCASEEGIGWVCEAARQRSGSLAGDAVRALLGQPGLDPLWSGLDASQRLSLGIEGLVGATLELAAPLGAGVGNDSKDGLTVGDASGMASGAVGRPLLVLVEDAHWARPVMVRLLDRLAQALPGAKSRLLLLATRRPPPLGPESEERGWSGRPGGRRIDLGMLSPYQVQRFLAHWLGPDWSLVELKAQVASRCQGVPLYLEEVLRTLEASSAIEGTPGAYRLIDPLVVHKLPRTLHALLAERIDMMTLERRRLLMNAAVIGTIFDVGLLQALTGLSTPVLSDSLAYLERAGFVLRTRLLPNLEYSFKHALIQEVAYATLTKSDRRALHARVLEALRHRRDHDLPNRLDLLAHHAFMAENWPAAHLFGRRAGEKAEGRSKLEDSSRHYANALAAVRHLSDHPRNTARQIDLLIALPRSLLPRGSMGVDDHLQRAIAMARESGDRIRYARACSMLASFLWTFGDLDQGLALCRDGLSALNDRDDRRTRVQLLFRLGGLLTDKGLFVDALETFELGAGMLTASRPHDRYGLATVAQVHMSSIAARCLAQLGRAEDAVEAGRRSVEIAEESNHLFSRLFALTHLGWTQIICGDLKDSIPAFEAALSIGHAIHAPLLLPLVMGGIGYASVLTGEREAGFAMFDRSFTLFHQQGGGKGRLHPLGRVPQVMIWYAQALASAGRLNEAMQAARNGLEIARNTSQTSLVAHAGRLMTTLNGQSKDDALEKSIRLIVR